MGLWAFEATDVHTPYGIVAVALLETARVRQLVLSCRVFGLGIEETLLQLLGRVQPWPDGMLRLAFSSTGRNQVALQNLTSAGLLRQGDVLQAPVAGLKPVPGHMIVQPVPEIGRAHV